MDKTVPTLRAVDEDEAPEMPAELRVALADIVDLAREGLLAMSVGVGLAVMVEMMEEELTAKVGPKNAKIPDRAASRHASAPGSVALGGRRVPMRRPRARTPEGTEVALETYATFTSDDLLTQVVLERMLAGVATRRHRAVAEPVGTAVEAKARSTSRSSVSRRFKAATATALEELMARDLTELSVAVMMIDGVNFAEQCCVVAMAICTDGTKVPVGLWLGDTENKTIVTNLLADLASRGLDDSGGLLFVLDGSKALAAGVKKVFGDKALVQRCTLHKRRNVIDHLPKDQRRFIDAKLAKAFANRDATAGLGAAQELAKAMEDRWPDAAASLREGLEEMFTVRRMGLSDALARTLTNTNAIESMISICRSTSRNVKRWRDGKMVKRWVAAGMLNAEGSFRRVKGCKDMPVLVDALARHAGSATEAAPARTA